ncbi:hypothetical protein EVAR_20114_1 [Eumeta japonica]|uniref:Uncharacterized protein n=1 Tax=Eumeta variegata TaxID=151549 RepID=A0A4C1V3L2_EUMVA|nr:hypothetical protein EVAR_20114_1 [Eumeta japonica]
MHPSALTTFYIASVIVQTVNKYFFNYKLRVKTGEAGRSAGQPICPFNNFRPRLRGNATLCIDRSRYKNGPGCYLVRDPGPGPTINANLCRSRFRSWSRFRSQAVSTCADTDSGFTSNIDADHNSDLDVAPYSDLGQTLNSQFSYKIKFDLDLFSILIPPNLDS